MPRPKKYKVALTDEERLYLLDLLKKGEAKARMLTRARILLLSAEGKTDPWIADALKVNPQTVRNIRKRFAEEGLEAALQERPRPGAQPKLDSKQEAFLIALACSEPPEGREHWTMQLLANRLVELEIVESISDETVRRVLKKRSQALAEEAVVHRTDHGGLPLAHGGCAGPVRRTLRPTTTGRLL
jgi:transposase